MTDWDDVDGDDDYDEWIDDVGDAHELLPYRLYTLEIEWSAKGSVCDLTGNVKNMKEGEDYFSQYAYPMVNLKQRLP